MGQVDHLGISQHWGVPFLGGPSRKEFNILGSRSGSILRSSNSGKLPYRTCVSFSEVSGCGLETASWNGLVLEYPPPQPLPLWQGNHGRTSKAKNRAWGFGVGVRRFLGISSDKYSLLRASGRFRALCMYRYRAVLRSQLHIQQLAKMWEVLKAEGA